MRVFIITPSFPPDTSIAARRWGNLINELDKIDVSATVVSEDKTISQSIRSEKYNKNKYIYLPSNNGEVNKPSAKNNQENTYLRKSLAFAKIKLKFLQKWIVPSVFDSSVTKYFTHYKKYSNVLIEEAKSCDVIICSYGPIWTILLGLKLSKVLNKKLVIDIRDCFESRDLDTKFIAKNISRRIEKFFLSKALFCTTVGVNLSHYLSEQYNVDFYPIFNGWVESDRCSEKSINKEGYLYYAGTIYEHQSQSLLLFLDALHEQGASIPFRVRLLKNTNSLVRRILDEHDYAKYISIEPPTDYATVMQESLSAKAIIIFEDLHQSNPWSSGTVTGKFLGLLSQNVHGIVICNAASEIKSILDEVDLENWLHINNINELTAKIEALSLSTFSCNNNDSLNKYSSEFQASYLKHLLIMRL